MNSFAYFDFMGLVGVALVIYCYARLQWQREFAKDIRYSAGNLIGSLFVMASLLDKWNLAAFVINLIMAAISLFGVFRCVKYKAEAAALAVSSEGCRAQVD